MTSMHRFWEQLMKLLGRRTHVLRVVGARPAQVRFVNGLDVGRSCIISVSKTREGREGPRVTLNGEDMFSLLQITRQYGASYSDAHAHFAKVPHVKFGKYIRVPRDAVDQWASERTNKAQLTLLPQGEPNESRA